MRLATRQKKPTTSTRPPAKRKTETPQGGAARAAPRSKIDHGPLNKKISKPVPPSTKEIEEEAIVISGEEDSSGGEDDCPSPRAPRVANDRRPGEKAPPRRQWNAAPSDEGEEEMTVREEVLVLRSSTHIFFLYIRMLNHHDQRLLAS